MSSTRVHEHAMSGCYAVTIAVRYAALDAVGCQALRQLHGCTMRVQPRVPHRLGRRVHGRHPLLGRHGWASHTVRMLWASNGRQDARPAPVSGTHHRSGLSKRALFTALRLGWRRTPQQLLRRVAVGCNISRYLCNTRYNRPSMCPALCSVQWLAPRRCGALDDLEVKRSQVVAITFTDRLEACSVTPTR